MFKDDYRKHYDELHPSKELMEKTKKLACDKLLQMQEEGVSQEKTEDYEKDILEEEKVVPFIKRKKRLIQVAGSIAAGVAILVTGVYFRNTLHQEEENVANHIGAQETPSSFSSLESTPVTANGKEKEKTGKKKGKKIKKPKKVQTNQYRSLAKMSRSGGVKLDYASGNRVIFHGNFGIIIYSLSQNSITTCISADEYIGDEWSQVVLVNADGSKIRWYNASDASATSKTYDLNTQEIEVEEESTEWEEVAFSGIQSVENSSADVYKEECKGGDMVSLGGEVCQLFYQAPDSGLQASLAISLVNPTAGTERIYSVFGSVGKSVVQAENKTYGGYHNENGKNILEKKEEEKNEEKKQEKIEETPEVTEPPEEKPVVTEPPAATPETVTTNVPETEQINE